MATNGSSGNNAVGADETTSITPEEVVADLRALRQRIPEYTQLPLAGSRSMRRAASVDVEFARAAINTIGASETMKTAVGRTPEELRRDEDEVTRWTAVEDELRAMLKGVSAANLVRRHRLGLAVLQSYNISRQLVRHQDHANLLPHVNGMKRMTKFSRRRKAPADTNVPAPVTVTPPVTVPQK